MSGMLQPNEREKQRGLICRGNKLRGEEGEEEASQRETVEQGQLNNGKQAARDSLALSLPLENRDFTERKSGQMSAKTATFPSAGSECECVRPPPLT